MTDPNASASLPTLFGLEHTPETASCIVLGVPWDVTASGKRVCAATPQLIVGSSHQVDLFDPLLPNQYLSGIALDVMDLRARYKTCSEAVEGFRHAEHGQESYLKRINEGCDHVVEAVKKKTAAYLDKGKDLILLGGDHSTSLGYINAVASRDETIGILQIDAHADLRAAYEGFHYSHASVMHNALKLPQITRLVQVGVRDYCHEENNKMEQDERIHAFLQSDLDKRLFSGETWGNLVEEIISALPDRVYVSFDIDGLSPENCPSTGTPVPGGLRYGEALYLLNALATTNKRIVGMDLVEVGSEPFDLTIAAHLLYHMSILFAKNRTSSKSQ